MHKTGFSGEIILELLRGGRKGRGFNPGQIMQNSGFIKPPGVAEK